ncbi:MAG: dTDP-4-dehydrorhamnose 3,5-epimerase [Saprospiraceae bacterium]|nr:dTDP-4-dehydrorhamnose 3,5-epimerase [Saprospiraceae bacterium]MCB0623992.1 dTDP-4-dehydrorhamnose 3,5-epimerase [Saprospiraceae bacterium]MCB0681696.1 dTDP-4-dehydrorhamnose 3,5-epimerase [Saprospiraceae bacterium]
MEIKERKFAGVFEIGLSPHLDERGFFMRVFDRNLFAEAGLDRPWVQENHSRTERAGVIRGLHFQLPPFAETKLVRCIRGSVLDVFVDLRAGSPTFGQWDSIELSETNRKMILIPRGFAHGFCTLSTVSEVLYKVDNVYRKDHESGLLWSDPDLQIDWPVQDPILSAKDRENMTFQQFCATYKAIMP